jgi:hypothetical protein
VPEVSQIMTVVVLLAVIVVIGMLIMRQN